MVPSFVFCVLCFLYCFSPKREEASLGLIRGLNMLPVSASKLSMTCRRHLRNGRHDATLCQLNAEAACWRQLYCGTRSMASA